MKIAITTVQVPFISGGAELHAMNLADAVRELGHEVDLVTMPFWFSPTELLEKYEDRWRSEDMSVYLSGSIDRVICLKYPTYFLNHPHKSLWLLHPLSSMYDFYGTPFGAHRGNAASDRFRASLLEKDSAAFAGIDRGFTVSDYLAGVIAEHTGVALEPLYHPPPRPDVYRCEGAYPFIFAPSRLEEQKRQDILIRAMQNVDRPLHLVVAGSGGQLETCRRLAEECGVADRIVFAGDLDRQKVADYYANCFAVYFGPFGEPYGYVTLEAMLSSKPVITCIDSGCPPEFVQDGQTGMVVEPDPAVVAESINKLWGRRAQAAEWGQAGRARYDSLGLNWTTVAQKLVA